MAANIDTLIYVGDVPWHKTGVDLTDNPPKTGEEIVRAASLQWKCNSTPLVSELHGNVPHYHAIYREDNNNILGVVNKAYPTIVQNESMFNTLDTMLEESIDVETAASLGLGETVFGCFKIREEYRLFDDDVAHYFLVVNDHLKPDGKVTVLNTPVRVVCQNTLSAALDTAHHKMRIPITNDTSINQKLSSNLIYSVSTAVEHLQTKAQQLYAKKVDDKYINNVLDLMFPYQLIDGKPVASTANERVDMVRATFKDNCLNVDNLQNYKGTQFQVFQALADFSQHYFKNTDKAFDINHRMRTIPGVVANMETDIVTKYLKVADKLAA